MYPINCIKRPLPRRTDNSPQHVFVDTQTMWKLIMMVCLALSYIGRTNIALGQETDSSYLAQARVADLTASKRASPGSREFLRLRNPALRLLTSSLLSTGRQLTLGIGPPNVNDDPRFRANLLAMLRESTSGPSARIFGGFPVSPTQFKEVVQLSGSGGRCTGTLITSTVVLTAGHCQCGHAVEKAFFGTDGSRPSDGKSIDVVKSIPKTDCATTANNEFIDPGNDFALVWLKQASNVVTPKTASTSAVVHAHDVHAVGFGYTETGQIGVKMQADIPIASANCSGNSHSETDAKYYGCAADEELVAAVLDPTSVRKDTCQGDSGGPIYVRSGSDLFLLGVTSRGVQSPGAAQCGDGGTYGLLRDDIIKWIRDSGVRI